MKTTGETAFQDAKSDVEASLVELDKAVKALESKARLVRGGSDPALPPSVQEIDRRSFYLCGCRKNLDSRLTLDDGHERRARRSGILLAVRTTRFVWDAGAIQRAPHSNRDFFHPREGRD